MHETMRRRSSKCKMVCRDDTNQEANAMRQGVEIKLGKKNQAEVISVQNFNTKKPPALAPLTQKSWPNGTSLSGTQLPPIQAPHKDEVREPLFVTRSIVNERNVASQKCAPKKQRPLNLGTIDDNCGNDILQVPTININGSEKISLYMTKDKLSLVKSANPANEQGEPKISEDGSKALCKAHNSKKGKKQKRENGRDNREKLENRYQDQSDKSSKLRQENASLTLDEAVNDVQNDFKIVPSTEVDLHIRIRTPESILQDPRLYRHTQPPFRVPPLRPVLPPIGGPRPGDDKKVRKHEKKKSREARRREKEQEWKSTFLEEDLKMKAFFQSLAMNRRDATCVEIDKLFNEGMLVKFSESLVLLTAMQWWL